MASLRGDPILAPSLRAFRGVARRGLVRRVGGAGHDCLVPAGCPTVRLDIRGELVPAFGSSARFLMPFRRPSGSRKKALARGFRLSRSKAETIHRLALTYALGELTRAELGALPDAVADERLTAIKETPEGRSLFSGNWFRSDRRSTANRRPARYRCAAPPRPMMGQASVICSPRAT